jgi:hypothetical protein
MSRASFSPDPSGGAIKAAVDNGTFKTQTLVIALIAILLFLGFIAILVFLYLKKKKRR